MKKTQNKIYLLIVIMAIIIGGCDNGDGGHHHLTVDEEIQAAWSAFQNESYSDAIQKANSALQLDPANIEAVVIQAWTYGRMGDFQTAISHADQIINTKSATENRIDALAVRAFSYWALNDVVNASHDAHDLLQRDAVWIFERGDSNVNYEDVYLLLAQCYWYQDELENCRQYLDPIAEMYNYSLLPEPDDPATWQINGENYQTYREALLMVMADLLIIIL